ncbi:MAG TPA: hypothetical protein VMT35_12010 [Ignavibacteriaceae bacterium]|nr:hypothetical protein [Ignavibacteriaceae bacterium]
MFSSETVGKSRNELMAECLKLGLPVRRDDSYKTLRLFLDLTYKKNSLFIDDELVIDEKNEKNFRIEKFFSRIYYRIKNIFV